MTIVIPVSAPTRLLVVDDHPVVREGLTRLLRREPDLSVAWVATGITDALDICSRNRPDLAIVDLSLQDGSGLDLVRALHDQLPDMPILVMSMYEAALYAERVLRAGARGYITKHLAPRGVVNAIRRVRDTGDIYIDEGSMAAMHRRQEVAEPPEGTDEYARARMRFLSDRELQVFGLIGKGLRKRDIAERLKLSTNTIETHRASIKKKLRLRSAAELSRFAFLQVNTDPTG